MKLLRLRSSIILLSLVMTAAMPATAAPPSRPPSGSEAAFLRENDAAMERMMAAMAVRPTGDVDRDFARMMIPHHQGGIDMARALLRHGKSPEMRALARAIIAKQKEEIALMRKMIGEPANGMPKKGMSMPMSMHRTMKGAGPM